MRKTFISVICCDIHKECTVYMLKKEVKALKWNQAKHAYSSSSVGVLT